VSDGGVHSHINHLYGLIDVLEKNNITNGFVHAFTDGRDVDPKSGLGFISKLQKKLLNSSIKLASVCGRYYSMDRDNRWERIKLAYDALVNGVGIKSSDLLSTIKECYNNGTTDEFLKPIIVTEKNDEPIAKIKDDDVVLFFNFRTDRGRQLTQALCQSDFSDQNMLSLNLHYVTMTNYDQNFKNIQVIFDKENIDQTLGEVLEKNGKTQLRIAETEKYPHVTFFFSGGREKPFIGEKRILKNSPKVATYDLKPEMSAYELSNALIPELKSKSADFICLNFANGDMVGHTGVMKAAIKACEAVDECVKKVVNCALENDYTTLLIADHGNCETMINQDGTPNTAHTTNPVPIILIDKNLNSIKDGILGNVAPTILKLLGVEKPKEMTQSSLI
jgi:2,3-bisphosphoglycerate-independent phosphoglycerate mutase